MGRRKTRASRSRSKKKGEKRVVEVKNVEIPVACSVCKSVELYTLEEISSGSIRCKKCGTELVLQPKDPYLYLQVQMYNMIKELLKKVMDSL